MVSHELSNETLFKIVFSLSHWVTPITSIVFTFLIYVGRLLAVIIVIVTLLWPKGKFDSQADVKNVKTIFFIFASQNSDVCFFSIFVFLYIRADAVYQNGPLDKHFFLRKLFMP